ncbi:DNA-binding response regulator, NarL/FixJ family, contains REC and HTH domains [Sinosporangium album]|uniref:DNA-binding response regulator, NarL/FixJ family, contains REC and HTH domains n=1 Tax=Sinosporangium album TaxID=504805 RepID=A0A1G7UY12_9ACTN|nr:response regulator transcription factor [Sinosporangium album]SDG52386.1 DNA-binding response regulator, NarL/FixJ family, contains REC and HTH domains [Sinosporangium album]
MGAASPVGAPTGPIRVALADDEAVVRMGLKAIISREPDLELVGEAADGSAALEVLRTTRPDILLLDLRMTGLDGIDTLRAIAADPELKATRVIVVTTFDTDRYVFAALQAGAGGFVLKDSAPEELAHAIRVVASGEALLSPSVTRKVIGLFGRHDTAPVEGLDTLTPREREMVAWVATGRSNDEIAAELVISPDTVRTHVSRAMVKLGARDRAQLVVFAVRSGLAVP